MSKMTYARAIFDGYVEAMSANPDVMTYGEDLYMAMFQVTNGLVEKFGPHRVRNTPISEAALVGVGVGAAVMGIRPIVEIQFADILCISMDHIVQSAAKIRYLSAGKMHCPLVVRAPMGIGLGMGMHHSQCVESWFMNVPGIKIVTPATPYDAKGLFLAAIEDDDPVLFLEHKKLYSMRGEVPEGYYTLPIGKGEIKREGSDVTIITSSYMLQAALEAANNLEQAGVQAEVLDLRTVKPLDVPLILESVQKTSRAVVVYESPKFGGLGAEISAVIAEKAIDYLAAPVLRVAGRETPVPFGMEEAVAPNAGQIVAAVKNVMEI